MILSEDEIFEKYAKQCKHCLRKTLLPFEYENTSISCGYNVIKQKNELTKIQRSNILLID